MGDVVPYEIFQVFKVRTWSSEDLAKFILGHPSCVYSPLLVQSRSHDQLVEYALRLLSVGSFVEGGSDEEGLSRSSGGRGQKVQRS